MRHGLAMAMALLSGCAMSTGGMMDAYEMGSGTTGGAPSGESNQQGAQAGTLTAGVWDDNLNFDFYLGYLENAERESGAPHLPRHDRLEVTVSNPQGARLGGVDVELRRADGSLAASSVTGAEGRVFFFPGFHGAGGSLQLVATRDGARVTLDTEAGADSANLVLDTTPAGVSQLDVALVIDTTGSMGDELGYLKVELDAIVNTIASRFPGVEQRWAVIVYRDEGDEYVTRAFDFSADIAGVRRNLQDQASGGGGDYPEALHSALKATAQLSWRGGNTARLAFVIADAPHHEGTEGALVDAVGQLMNQGVHVYPVAASGVSSLAEHAMRTAAQVTGGRYLFLTDDSGVGGSHREPTVPCYVVTRLDHAMLRMVSIEMTGVITEPSEDEVIRVGGDPSDGRCTLDDGTEVLIL